MPGFAVSFRIIGAEVDPEEVSDLLGLQPSVSHRLGDPHYGKQGRRYADYNEGLWALNSPLGEDRPLGEHLQYLELKLKERELALREFRSKGYRLDCFIGIFEIGDGDEVFLSASELKVLVDLGLDVCFDLFTLDDTESAEQ